MTPGRAALPAPTPQGPGSEGARALPDVSRAEARLIGRAVAGRWPMDETLRADVVDVMATIVRNAGVFDPRVVTTAAKVLLDADRINLDAEAREAKAPDVVTGPDGRVRVDFSKLTDDELERFLGAGQ